jgi:hypothetical protein
MSTEKLITITEYVIIPQTEATSQNAPNLGRAREQFYGWQLVKVTVFWNVKSTF